MEISWLGNLTERECPCARLLRRWNTDDPPNVICYAVARASVLQVAEDWWSDLITAVTPNTGLVQPLVPWPALQRAFPHIAEDLQELNEHVQESAMLERWPFPWKQRWLVLVLRQWAQEEPNQTVANQLASAPEWQHLLDWIRLVWKGRPTLLHDVADELARYGLPTSPATIGFALASAVGVENVEQLSKEADHLVLRANRDGSALPARGLLVTTLIYAMPDQEFVISQPAAELDKVPWIIQSNPDVTISGDLEHARAESLRVSQKVATGHRQFVQAFASHPFSLIGSIRKAQRHAFSRSVPPGKESFDYFEVACRDLHPMLPLLQQYAGKPGHLDDALKPHLDRILRKVGERRTRARFDRTPPKGWRTQVRSWVQDQLNA